ncbi:MAG: Fic family protein [Crocinitomicaceae bacterium]|nr:MAG: Fic family protein [Crocinitomicaceae bacterium]
MNATKMEFYKTPNAMEPLFPDGEIRLLEKLAIELIEKSNKLEGTMNPFTRKAVSDFLRPMNSYYSNLIEGHDTHPIDIAKALKNDYSSDKIKRDLQLEALAHIQLHKALTEEITSSESELIPTTSDFLKRLHFRFYEHLPEEFKLVKSIENIEKHVIPGEYRNDEVKVGRHIAPYSGSIELFMERFETFYNPKNIENSSKIKRIISIAASHHRLAWIHPFLDGNGRVVRLYSDACFLYEKLDAVGLWSISRGLARRNTDYKAKLANADLRRYNDYDGRGNLSNKMLLEFCVFFLETSIDQVNYMYEVLDKEHMLSRINGFVDLMVVRKKLRPEARYILEDLFLKGKITKTDVERITNLSEKTAKIITDSLEQLELVRKTKEGIHVTFHVNYPVNLSPFFFPGIYPSSAEAEMMRLL